VAGLFCELIYWVATIEQNTSIAIDVGNPGIAALWHSHRNEVDNILTLEETKTTLKRAVKAWKKRDEFSDKIGEGRYAVVGYDKIKRITMPLKNDHMLFVSVQADKPEYMGDLIKIVDYVEQHPSQN